MKKTGILNVQLAGYIAGLGHKETFLIADAGMSIPKGVPIVDLALCAGVPTFEQTLKAVLVETKVEYYYFAEEIYDKNPKLLMLIQELLPDIEYQTMSHEALKEFTKDIKFAIRTGEFSPYPNVVLSAGVVF